MKQGGDDHEAMKTAFVIVLGDLGRSPRMCNHALSLANEGFSVTLLGYGGSSIKSELANHSLVQIKTMLPFPSCISQSLPRLLCYGLKVFWQTLLLFCSLPVIYGPDFILLQNPPTIPLLVVCYVYSFLHPCTKLVVDWHNYGYSILALALGKDHILVKFSKAIEDWIGRRVKTAFCVSKAMKKDLETRLNLCATVLYDRPPEFFRPISLEERHQLFENLGRSYPDVLTETVDGNRINRFSELTPDGVAVMKPTRPGILVSSTSWTEDEDFSILLDALTVYEAKCSEDEGQGLYPNILCVITGKGPLKEFYRNLISSREWGHVSFLMPWLEPDDYARILAAADLGVSLHASSSGLDLPMKVVDMFGCGLPVAAKGFPALPELVKDGINGMIFNTPDELANHIFAWFKDFPSARYERRRRPFCTHLERFRADRWANHWRTVALPIFQEETE